MGTSKKRGGAKAHRKRVAARNQEITAQRSAMQKLMNESMKMQIEELKKERLKTQLCNEKNFSNRWMWIYRTRFNKTTYQ
jgi:hypothetical protein